MVRFVLLRLSSRSHCHAAYRSHAALRCSIGRYVDSTHELQRVLCCSVQAAAAASMQRTVVTLPCAVRAAGTLIRSEPQRVLCCCTQAGSATLMPRTVIPLPGSVRLEGALIPSTSWCAMRPSSSSPDRVAYRGHAALRCSIRRCVDSKHISCCAPAAAATVTQCTVATPPGAV